MRAARIIGATQDITEKILLEKKVAEERSAVQKEITDAVMTAQEKERSDIESELHDNVNQILSAAKLYIGMVTTDKKEDKLLLAKSFGFISSAINEIRKISRNLAASDVQMIGLFGSIKHLLNDLSKNSLKIKFNKNSVIEKDLDNRLQLNIYRIVQEQVTNVLKHAKATLATIDLSIHENNLILLISDNGRGWDTSEKRKGVGLRNIMSRAESCFGKAEIKSQPGKGFQVKIILPTAFISKPLIQP
jgi:signal transduction histidine kinase